MFEVLSEKLSAVFRLLGNRGKLTEKDIDEAMRQGSPQGVSAPGHEGWICARPRLSGPRRSRFEAPQDVEEDGRLLQEVIGLTQGFVRRWDCRERDRGRPS